MHSIPPCLRLDKPAEIYSPSISLKVSFRIVEWLTPSCWKACICSLGPYNSNKHEMLRHSCVSTEWKLFYTDSLASSLSAQFTLPSRRALVLQSDEHPGKSYWMRISNIDTGLVNEWTQILCKKFWNFSECQFLLLFSSQWHTFLCPENTTLILVIYCWILVRKKWWISNINYFKDAITVFIITFRDTAVTVNGLFLDLYFCFEKEHHIFLLNIFVQLLWSSCIQMVSFRSTSLCSWNSGRNCWQNTRTVIHLRYTDCLGGKDSRKYSICSSSPIYRWEVPVLQWWSSCLLF